MAGADRLKGTASRRRALIRVGILLAALAVFALVVTNGFTVVQIDDEEEKERAEEFNATTYVDGVWDEVRSTISEGAADLFVVLGEIEPDESGFVPKDELVAVAEEHGLITVGEALVFWVEATGTVTEVDTSSSTGTLQLDVEGYDGPIAVNVYIGPRIPSDDSSVRDAAGFIQFGDFREQTEYGKVAAEINARVLDEVLSSLDAESLVGKQVTVAGAFTIRTFNVLSIDVSEINIVPLSIEVAS